MAPVSKNISASRLVGALLALVVGGPACQGNQSGFASHPTAGSSPGAGSGTPASDPGGEVKPDEPVSADPAPLQPSRPIAEALGAVPASVAARYVFSLSADRSELTIDPRPEPTRERRDVRGFSARESENGGKIITLSGGPFRHGEWVTASFSERVREPGQLEELRRAGYDLEVRRDLLVVDGEGDPSPTVFAFSADPKKLGIVGVCSTTTILDFGVTGPKNIAVRKPVIYLYPSEPTRVNVRLELDGELVADYPKLSASGWTVLASPSGELLDEATGRHHRYLFWEGTSAGFELDPSRAHCVPADEATTFLEGVCDGFSLTDPECGDFVSYWLPTLLGNPYTLVELVEASTYARYAQLHITPQPDTVIRPFMILRRSEVPVDVGAPAFPRPARRGFTVVEWGGADLDELARTR